MTIDAITIVLATTAGVAALALFAAFSSAIQTRRFQVTRCSPRRASHRLRCVRHVLSSWRSTRSVRHRRRHRALLRGHTSLCANPWMRILIRLLLAFVEHAPWLMLRSRFTSLTPERRREVFLLWTRARFNFYESSSCSLRTLLSFGYMANAEVCRTIGAVSNATPFEAPPRSSRDENPPRHTDPCFLLCRHRDS